MLDETSYEVKISEVAQVIEVEIVNEYVHGNIKLTNSNVGLWTALAGLSALGIVGTAIVAYRKKKKEDNE